MESFMSSDELKDTLIMDADPPVNEIRPVFRDREKGRDISPLVFKLKTYDYRTTALEFSLILQVRVIARTR